MRDIWYCHITSHEHHREVEAQWCTELYNLWQMATVQLMAYVREDEVECAVNQALGHVTPDEEAAC